MIKYLSFLLMIFPLLLVINCAKKDTGKNLTMEKVAFSWLDNSGSPVPISNEAIKKGTNPVAISSEPVYKKGQALLIVMHNVSGFKKGADSLNKMELDVEIKGPDGLVLFGQKNMLGERGHLNLQDNIAHEPYATYNIPADAKTGRYIYRIRISDLITNKDIAIKGRFKVE